MFVWVEEIFVSWFQCIAVVFYLELEGMMYLIDGQPELFSGRCGELQLIGYRIYYGDMS